MRKSVATILTWCAVTLLTGAGAASAAADDPPAEIKPREAWSSVFADSEVKFSHSLRGPKDAEVAIAWRLAVADRTVARGEATETLAGDGSGSTTFSVRIPQIKSGVTLGANLSVELQVAGDKANVARHERPIWIFGRDPFADRQQWLKGLKIKVFDPAHSTAETLEKAGVVFQTVHRISADDVSADDVPAKDVSTDKVPAADVPAAGGEAGILIVGEGMKLDDARNLFSQLNDLAHLGRKIVLLAPASGSFAAPLGAGEVSPLGVSLRQSDVISELDKRLDAKVWTGGVDPVLSRFALVARRSGITAEVSREDAAWPWLDFRFASGGRIIVCGFGIAAAWEKSPVPRFLLRRILETLDNVDPKDIQSAHPQTTDK